MYKVLPLLFLLAVPLLTGTAQEPRKLVVSHPLTAGEQTAAARLTQRPTAQLWWNDKSRVVGASFKGMDADDRTVELASQLPGLRTLVLVPLPHASLTNQGLAKLAQLPDLEFLSLAGRQVTDAGLIHIQQLRTLRALALHCALTDQGMPYLADLPQLEQLDLTQTNVTDAGLEYLTGLPRLHSLILNGTQVTSAGMAQLAEIKTITHLYVGATELDDSAVEHLKTMEQLQLLNIRDTRITEQGVAELAAALLEGCQIIHHATRARGTRSSPIAMTASPPVSAASWRAAK